jgi:hypothetical protein
MLPQGMGGALKVPKPIQGFKLSQNIYLSNVESNIFSQLETRQFTFTWEKNKNKNKQPPISCCPKVWVAP